MTYHPFVADEHALEPRGTKGTGPCRDCGGSELSMVHLEAVDVQDWETAEAVDVERPDTGKHGMP